MKQAMQTQRAQEHVARESARNTVLEVAERNPQLLAQRLVASPELTQGLRDFDYLVDVLLKGGQRELLMQLAEATTLRSKERKILVTKLLVA